MIGRERVSFVEMVRLALDAIYGTATNNPNAFLSVVARTGIKC